MYKSVIVKTASAVVPGAVKKFLRFLILKSAYPRNDFAGKRLYCPVCNTHVWRFDPIPMWYLKTLGNYGFIHSIFAFETLNLFAYACPSCGASDRNRLYALYFS